ncbi:MAG: alkaline phosphatase family protein [Planctomycetota bacterium]|nr:alkaline phosphatase family protein [Planctomycetota bacterium]
MAKRRLLLVGWDAADWKVIQPLVDAGQMPNLARLLERGVMGNLASLQPMLSPMLWTSIASGKRPYKHGVHGFSEVDGETGQIRPISARSRTTKAIWNILHQEGKTCHVVGWWPSHPVEPLRGGMVSDFYKAATAELGKPWPLTPGTVHPPELAAALTDLRIHPAEIEGDMLRAFVPRAPEIDQEKDKRLQTLAKLIAEVSSVHAAATHLLHTQPDWDFCAVYHDAIDHFCHAFMKYHPPRLDWVPEQDFELYSQVVGGAYVLHDSMLGVMLTLAGDDTTVLLVSDHGFHPDHLRPKELPNEPAGPAAEHRPLGIFVAAGPGIRRDELIFGASLLDVAPTVLSLFDLPTGRDMDGRPLLEIFEHPPSPRFIDSWDDVPGDAARLELSPGDGDSESAAAVIKQLADLGYIDAVPEDRQEAIDQTIREERWNLARALTDGGRLEEAAAMLVDLWNRWPDEGRFGVALLQNRLDLGHLVEARETFDLLLRRKQAAAERAAGELAELMATIRTEQGLPAEPAGDSAAAEPAEAIDFEKLSEKQQRTIRRLRGRALTNVRTFAFLEGSILAAERRYPEALQALERAEGVQASQRPGLLLKKAEVLLAMRQTAAAAEAFDAVLAIDPINAAARFGRSRAALAAGDAPRALAEAKAAIGCRYHFPRAQLVAGLAAWRTDAVNDAETFMRTAVSQQPLFPAGHRLLARFLERVRGDLRGAIEHRRLAAESRKLILQTRSQAAPEGRHRLEIRQSLGKPEPAEPAVAFTASLAESVVVVTGLPRSGTSMAMQILAAGGLALLADDERLADESNPRGYLEYEPAKRLVSDASWVAGARGQAVKIVAPLVRHLPRGEAAPPYLVIHMRRPIDEVIASQRTMLERLGRPGADTPDQALMAVFERQQVMSRTFLAHLESAGRARVLDLHYHDALADPAAAAAKLGDLLGEGFDAAAATAAIDRSLHRTRKKVPGA